MLLSCVLHTHTRLIFNSRFVEALLKSPLFASTTVQGILKILLCAQHFEGRAYGAGAFKFQVFTLYISIDQTKFLYKFQT